MPSGSSPAHFLVIFVVALVVLGPDKFPGAMRKGAGVATPGWLPARAAPFAEEDA